MNPELKEQKIYALNVTEFENSVLTCINNSTVADLYNATSMDILCANFTTGSDEGDGDDEAKARKGDEGDKAGEGDKADEGDNAGEGDKAGEGKEAGEDEKDAGEAEGALPFMVSFDKWSDVGDGF